MKFLLGLGLITFGVMLGLRAVSALFHRPPKPLPVIATVPEDATEEWKAHIPPIDDEGRDAGPSEAPDDDPYWRDDEGEHGED